MSLTELQTKALVLNKKGQYHEAVKAAEKALEITEEKFGSDHPETAASMTILGLLYFSHGKYSNTEPLYVQALKINEAALGKDHVNVAADLDNLALLYQAQGRLSESIPLYKRALQIKEKTLEPGHQDIATLLNNLITLYTAQGRHSMAKHYHDHLQSTWDSALKQEPGTRPGKQGTTQTLNRWKGHVYSSKFSRNFHLPDCEELPSSPDDTIDFQSREHAIRDGAVPCSVCNP
ncbi:Tfp pilus assembly protein [Candidatus Scalindua japonica]|uniref:Tfp pilus assembly protein n=2 Tax=Candidatus Scalindua japonica TaxID=1284222 RepID=A0A286TU06_9BACT|nr:Tfp pilus assembly protein [Candidatus Scalindua japonica]